MTVRQSKPLSPPRPGDEELLIDFSAVVQDSFDQLYDLAHTHPIKSVAPASNEGSTGDIVLVQTATTFSIYAKFSSGWKSVTLS